MERITQYQTKDGKIFNKLIYAEKHELSLDIAENIIAKIIKIHEPYDRTSAILDHKEKIAETLATYREDFLKILLNYKIYLLYKTDLDSGDETLLEVSFDSRYLSDRYLKKDVPTGVAYRVEVFNFS